MIHKEDAEDAASDTGSHIMQLRIVSRLDVQYVSVKRDSSGKEVTLRRHNSYSTINGYKSAIKFLYTERKCDVSNELESTLAQFANGYKRHVAQLKEDVAISMAEADQP
ncbi:hypothetical protein H310_09704 [Aphanomyces invadans]|uniref:Uncharacterized protein n=1 Tax=Aphanomyces invadans TaxID=157072 RepID=A0A024TTM9_9STRA|nr:hypothetical protein H310_09704 [Aphanomyces invadans]ETV97369.1 hypothetical protein H310_09704 [Aphanomyces invadans]|eukprot:XP_008874077.1 hypothetical protein H310_09704 [Aphanomyces invadans]